MISKIFDGIRIALDEGMSIGELNEAARRAAIKPKPIFKQTNPALPSYRVYYWNNDGQKEIVEDGLTYEGAVKLWQWHNTYEPINFLGYEVQK